MDSIEIASAKAGGLRLDFPSEKQIAALASAWDDDANHQVVFLRQPEFRAAQRSGEYASMVASADLALPAAESVAKLAAKAGGTAAFARSIPIGTRRREYLSYFGPPADDPHPVQAYSPLKVLAILLSALEQRRGSVFLVGGALPALQRAELHLRSTFPELRVVGRSTGDYGEANEPLIMRALQKASPDMVVVGSLVKDGELWIPRHMRYTKSGIFVYEAGIVELFAGRR
ncbi:WecB/TagA/CpsF family glycosyltransferase [bacterium]|nr:WecB/TagA/CpsF family glycosyltransferase [bacterium]